MGGFGFPPVEGVEYSAPAPVSAMFELRPLSTGEILDRTFALYRQRFWLYVGLSSVTAAVTTLTTFAQITVGTIGRAIPQTTDAAALMRLGTRTMSVTLVVLLVHLLAYSITQAATVSAVEANYLGRETSIGAAFRAVGPRWYRYIGVTLWQVWSVMWPMLLATIPAAIIAVAVVAASAPALAVVVLLLTLIPGLVIGLILYLRNSLGIVACVSEGLTAWRSMKRSRFLVADHKTRAFLLYLLMLVLGMAVGVLQGIFNFFLMRSHGGVRAGVEVSTLLVTFLSGALVQPVGAIAFVLFYIDQRVRKEGFDVEMLLEKVSGVAPPPRATDSPFSSPFSSAPATGSSPFTSGPLPGSTDVKTNG